MSGARTEEPTPRRLREARRRGEVATSRPLVGAAALAGGLAALALGARGTTSALAALVRGGLESALRAEPRPLAAAAQTLDAAARASAPVLAASLAAGAAAGLLVTGGLFAPGAARPRLSRVDPAAGLRRLASAAQAAGTALALARAAAAVAVAAPFFPSLARALAGLPALPARGLLGLLPDLLAPLAWRLAGALLVLGLLDLLLARRRHRRALRMTRQEVAREQREDEGDPARRGLRREAHRALAEAGPVAGAAVLVVNPAHLAVALAHRRGDDAPPVVLAKGSGGAAARLRAQARRAGVPVVRDVPLARSLFRLAGVGEAIPPELFEAAAALLVRVHGLAPEALR